MFRLRNALINSTTVKVHKNILHSHIYKFSTRCTLPLGSTQQVFNKKDHIKTTLTHQRFVHGGYTASNDNPILIYLFTVASMIVCSIFFVNHCLNKDARADTNQPFIIIGVTGRARSGKDTVGEYLINNYGFKRLAFADSLKNACESVFGFSHDQLYGDSKEKVDEYWKHTPREIFQKVGTELFRIELPKQCSHIGDDIWIRSVDRKIQNLKKAGCKRVVITDMRFKNEKEFINAQHGLSIKTVRNISNNQSNHASEVEIDGFQCDITFDNNKTLKELYNAIDEEMKKLNIQSFKE